MDQLSRSPGSHIAPADSFTDISWIDAMDVQVLKVTNLDNSGEGSLRWAINQSGPRLVVFEVGGVIDLEERRLTIEEDNCWIAGHTAPSPGITLIRGRFLLAANQCIVQHVRSRPGDAGNSVEDGWQPDAMDIDDGARDNLIDHCTAMWSVDEALSVGYHSRRSTVTNCMIAEPLHHSTHPKGAHGYGSLIGDGATQVTYAGNLLAHASARNPRLKNETETVVANNVMYDFEEGTNLDGSAIATIQANAYIGGTDGAPIEGVDSNPSRAAVNDNYVDRDVRMATRISDPGLKPYWPRTMDAVPGEEAIGLTLENTGARPADRDSHETRVVQHVRNRTGSSIDSQDEVGGYPEYGPTTRSLTVPESGDGLAEWLYRHRQAVEVPDATPP